MASPIFLSSIPPRMHLAGFVRHFPLAPLRQGAALFPKLVPQGTPYCWIGA